MPTVITATRVPQTSRPREPTARPAASGAGKDSFGVTSPKSTLATTREPSHRLPCTDAEVMLTRCQHEGECVVVQMSDNVRHRIPECRCKDEWDGKHCEHRYVDPQFWSAVDGRPVQKASLAGGLAVALLVFAVVIFGAFVYYRYRTRDSPRRRSTTRRSRSSSASQRRSINLNQNEKNCDIKDEFSVKANNAHQDISFTTCTTSYACPNSTMNTVDVGTATDTTLPLSLSNTSHFSRPTNRMSTYDNVNNIVNDDLTVQYGRQKSSFY